MQRRPITDASIVADAHRLMASHGPKITAAGRQIIETTYPAQRIINALFDDIGVNRFPGGRHDLWEAMEALRMGSTYQAPPKHLIERWRAY